MDNHNVHCGCKDHDHSHGTKEQSSYCRKWLFAVFFLVFSFFIFRFVLIQQILNRASAYVSFGLYDEGIRQYNKALLFDRHNSNIYATLGYIYYMKKDIPSAISAYSLSIKHNPAHRDSLFNLGMIYYMEKNYKESIKYFSAIAGLGPEKREKGYLGGISYHRSALCMLVDCYEELGRKFDEKITLLRYLYFYPNDTEAKSKLDKLN